MREPPRDLETIERWLQAVITEPAGIVAGLASEEAQRNLDVSAEPNEKIVTRSNTLTAPQRLAIYGPAYFARLQGCPHADFAVLLHAPVVKLLNLFAFEY